MGIFPIGMELSLEKLHLVQTKRDADGNLAIRAFASEPLPCSRDEVLAAPRMLRSVLARALKSAPFKGRRAVLAMPAGLFRTLSVTYQLASGQNEDSIIGRLMSERLEGNLSDYVIDYLPVRARTRNGEQLAIVAVSSRDMLEGLPQQLRL